VTVEVSVPSLPEIVTGDSFVIKIAVAVDLSFFGSGRKIFDLSIFNVEVFVSPLPNGAMEIFNVCLFPEESVCFVPIYLFSFVRCC
jgi:hypothetical protein